DSGGGAGIQADIKSVTMRGGHAMTASTAITAQNTLGVSGVHAIPVDMVLAQIDAVGSDIGVDAVKIGMIGSGEIADAVTRRHATLNVPIVFDPVMITTSGSVLADPATIAAFERLMRIAAVATPNLDELAALGGREAVLAHGCHLAEKGGHGVGPQVHDQLFAPDGTRIAQVIGQRIDTAHSHGTGCSFASALACGLAAGLPMAQAFERAVHFTRAALLNAPGLGQGHGPIGHALGVVPFDVIKG